MWLASSLLLEEVAQTDRLELLQAKGRGPDTVLLPTSNRETNALFRVQRQYHGDTSRIPAGGVGENGDGGS